MAGSRRIVVEFLGKDKSAGKTANAVEKQFGKLGRNLDKVGQKAGKALAGGLLLAGAAAVKFGNQASDLAETQSKVAQIFGKDSVDALDKFAEGAAKSMGQSKQTALDAAATFGMFGKMAKLSGKELVGFSTEMTGLASDMASFSNTSPEEAIEAIGSALRGEAEPIRKYGVLLDDATLRQEALRMGLIKTTKDALTPQQKVLAAQAAIMKQTSDQQGDFAKTSDGLANKQRILKAELENMSTALGAKALPFMLKAVEVGGKMSKWANEHQELVGVLAASIGTLAAGLYGASLAMRAFTVAMAMNPVGLIAIGAATAIAGMGALIVATRRSGDEFKYTLPKMDQYIETLDGVAAATSRATREMVLERLEKTGLLEQTQALNIADRDAVLAAMGNEAARKRVSVALRQAVTEGKNYEALQVARRLGSETTAINSSRVAQLKKNLALAATKEEAAKIQAKLDKLAKTNASPQVKIGGAGTAINQLTAIAQLLNDVTRKRGGNAQVPGTGSVLSGLSSDNTGPGKASGGRVWAGTTYPVGERGMELFTPEMNGYITPAHKVGEGGGSSDVAVAAPLVLQLDSKTVWQGLLKMKRTGGIVELGLA